MRPAGDVPALFELLHQLSGRLLGDPQVLGEGADRRVARADPDEREVAYVPSGSEVRLDGGPGGGAARVTSLAGLEATMSDGSTFRPPWTR
jgi:hypothetical protein